MAFISKTTNCRSQTMSLTQCPDTTCNACWTLNIWRVIGRCHLANVSKLGMMLPSWYIPTWLMYGGLAFICPPLADIFWPMHAYRIQCCLGDFLKQWLKTPSRCAHDMTDVCRPWMRLHALGRYHFPDTYLLCSRMKANVSYHIHKFHVSAY